MTQHNTNCDSCASCPDCEKWDLKQIGGWKGFIKRLYAHHKPSGGALILRIAIAMVFIYEGLDKLGNIAGTAHFFGSLGMPLFAVYFVAWVELLGGIFILLGFLTKPTCVALAIDMAVVVFGVHMGKAGGYLWGHTYESFILLTLLALYVMGPGKYSLARVWLQHKKR